MRQKLLQIIGVLCTVLSAANALAVDSTSPTSLPATDAATPSAEQLIEKAEAAIAKVNDYTAVMLKQERFKEGLHPEELLQIKFSRPFKVYVKYLRPFSGREVIFVQGWNDNELRVHKGSFPDISVSLDPRGGMAMDSNHHPVLDFGIENTIHAAAKNLRLLQSRGEGTITVSEVQDPSGKKFWKVEASYPSGGATVTLGEDETLWDVAKRSGQDMYLILFANAKFEDPDDPDQGDAVFVPRYYGAKAELQLDQETFFPLKICVWDWNGRLYERFEYRDLKLNVGLTNKDFDPENPAYDF